MKITETRLTAAGEERAREINSEIDEYVYSRPEKFGRTPGGRGIQLQKYCRDDVLDALYEEYRRLPRETYEIEVSDASYTEY